MLIDAGLAVLHVATGLFFVTSGARKCFIPDVRAKVCGLFDRHGVPKPLQWMVMGGEFFGGLGLLFGCLTRGAALGLLIIMMGAYLMDTYPEVKAKQTGSKSQFLSNCLCTPEAQLIFILTAILLMGAGAFSLDYFIL